MIAALFGDKAARQFDNIAAHDGRHEGPGVQRLREDRQSAERVIDPREVLFQMTADVGRRLQAR